MHLRPPDSSHERVHATNNSVSLLFPLGPDPRGRVVVDVNTKSELIAPLRTIFTIISACAPAAEYCTSCSAREPSRERVLGASLCPEGVAPRLWPSSQGKYDFGVRNGVIGASAWSVIDQEKIQC